MARRKIIVDGVEYFYTVGKHSLVLETPEGKRVVDLATVKRCSPDDIDRGRYKKTSDGMILPSEVARYIRQA